LTVFYLTGGIVALFLYALLALPFFFIFNSATYTDMNVLSVETGLPITFSDSQRRGDDSFIYYQFELQPEKPLTLSEVIISNGKESKSFSYFEPDYNRVSFWGNALDDSIGLLQEPSDDSQNQALLYSKTRLLTHDTLEATYWREETENRITHFHEDDLNVLFVFENGTANVHYKFFDREIMHRSPFQ